MIPLLPLIAVLNFSHVPNPTVAHWVDVIQRQVTDDLAPVWHMNAQLRFYSSTERPPETAWQVRIVEGRGYAGNAAYHLSVDDKGLPYADVYNIRGLHTDASLSHEVLEMLTDPYSDRFVEDFPYMWFLEIADPVQFNDFVRDGVHLSNFVFPAWFDALTRDGVRLDYLGVCTTPGHPHEGKAIRMDERNGRREVVY